MPNEELQEKMVEKVINLFEELNAEILENVGKSIKKIGKLTPTKAHQLVQQLMYGEDYNKIIRKITKVTGLGKKEIENIFIDAAKKNQKFAKQFYDAKKVPFTSYEKNKLLQKEVDAFIKSTEQYYKKITDTGFYIVDGKKVPIKDVYNHMLEKSLMSVSTGQTTYQEEMRRITKEMAAKGIRTRIIEGKDTGTYIVDYASGRTRRLDSVLRMHLLGAMRDMSNKLQEDFGKEFGADGIEISVHINPAIDHENAQGHQFKFKEYEKLNKGLEATDYKGNRITLDHDENGSYRPVSTLNCRHYEWQIVLGVSKPRYSQEQLDEIIRKNKEGFEFEGKHYTNYEGTQLQRQIETKIRNYKDQQIMAKARGDMEDAEKCQKQIKILTRKYNDLHKISGLPTKKDRMVVSGYHPIKVDVPVQAVEKPINLGPNKIFISAKENRELGEYYWNAWKDRPSYDIMRFKDHYEEIKKQMENGFEDEIIDISTFDGCNKLLGKVNGVLYGDEIKEMDIKLISEASKSIYENIKKCPSWLKDSEMNFTILRANDLGYDTIAETRMGNININSNFYKDYEKLLKMEKEQQEIHEYLSGHKNSWHVLTSENNITLQPITHEQGHIIHQRIADEVVYHRNDELIKYFDYLPKSEYGNFQANDVRKELIEIPIKRVMQKEKITRKEVIDKYVSEYGKSDFQEMFAEMFANSQLGKSNKLGDELIEFLKEIKQWK